MATRGFLIRFIDIGLIVLFGFLMISDIEASSRVELGATPDEELEEPREDEEDQAFIVVLIDGDGSFVVQETVTRASPSEALVDEASTVESGDVPAGGVTATAVRVVGIDGLESAIRTLRQSHQEAGLESVILIEPHPASAVQRTVDVMDTADRLGIPKSLRMDIEVVAPTGGDGGGVP